MCVIIVKLFILQSKHLFFVKNQIMKMNMQVVGVMFTHLELEMKYDSLAELSIDCTCWDLFCIDRTQDSET